MRTVMFIVPACIILFLVIRKTWRIYKDGLLLALLQLGLVAVSAVAAFVLTRVFFNPSKVDAFGLGQMVMERIPAGFFAACPDMEPFVWALPTAVVALLAFTLFFEILRVAGARVLSWVVKKNKWNETHLQFPGSKVLAVAVSAVTAVLALLIDLVILNGVATFSGNMLHCAQAATGKEIFGVMAEALDEYEKSPVKRITDALGCKKVYFALTGSCREGQGISMGEELNQISNAIAGLMPLFEVFPTEDSLPDAQALRDLPGKLAENPESLELLAGLARASGDKLAESDAVLIMSTLLNTTPERFGEYLEQVEIEETQKDLQTFCNIAALLRENDLLPKQGSTITLNELKQEDLLADVRVELQNNPELAAFFSDSE